MSIIIYQNNHDIARLMTLKFIAISHSKKNCINIALSGGETPKIIFQNILKSEKQYLINWSKLHFWWTDERCVQAQSPESNYGEVKRILFQHVGINPQNLHPINGEISPKKAALSYKKLLEKHLPIKNNLPYFDWTWLGMGEDGHTASLFVNDISPNTANWAEVVEHPTSKQRRVTLTLCVLNNSKAIDFIVTGQSKSRMLKKVLEDKIHFIKYPAKLIQPTTCNLIWHIDKLAAAHLSSS